MNDFLLEKQACSFRSENGLNNSDPIRLQSLLQKLNVISVFAPLKENFSGMALKVNNSESADRFIMVNNEQSLGKQHFTICHELYHLFIQQNFSNQVCITAQFDKYADKNEYYADVFASYLLLPSDGLLENIPDAELEKKRITLQTILFLEQYYSSSRKALLYRLRSMKLITEKELELYSFHVKKSALENGLPVALYEPGNKGLVIGDYGKKARQLFDQEKISESHYYSLLGDIGIDISKIDESGNGDE